MKIIFVRHGEPDYAKDSLTENGWREAECLAGRISKWQVTDLLSSLRTRKGYRRSHFEKNEPRGRYTGLDAGIFLSD